MTRTIDVTPVAAPPRNDHPGAVRAGLVLTYLVALSSPWNALRLGQLALSDMFLVLAAMALVLADMRHPLPKLPPWISTMLACTLAIGVINQFAPVTSAYLISRDQLSDTFQVLHFAVPQSTNLIVLVPLLVRLFLLPFVFLLAQSHDARAPRRTAVAFVAGAAFSALIAFPDSRGWTSIGPSLVGVNVGIDGRASGLTQSPNVVAMTCVLALPLSIWLIVYRRHRRAWAVAALLLLLLGLYASGSRSGAGAAGIAGLCALLWLPQYRRLLPTIGLGVGLVAAAAFVANPSLGAAVLRGLRLTGSDTSGSDQARSLVNNQAWTDFHHSPIYGNGLEIAGQAHIVYVQALAVGGVILLAGLVAYLLGALVRCARLAHVEPLAIPLFAAILGGAIVNAAQNALLPTFVYVLPSLAATLSLAGARRPRDAAQPLLSHN